MRITEREFTNESERIHFIPEREYRLLSDEFRAEHPQADKVLATLADLAFHNPDPETFERLLNFAKNAVLVIYSLSRKSEKIGLFSDFNYSLNLAANKKKMADIQESGEPRDIARLTEEFLVRSEQPFLYPLLYAAMPHMCEKEWDKGIAMMMFVTLKSVVDTLSKLYR